MEMSLAGGAGSKASVQHEMLLLRLGEQRLAREGSPLSHFV